MTEMGPGFHTVQTHSTIYRFPPPRSLQSPQPSMFFFTDVIGANKDKEFTPQINLPVTSVLPVLLVVR